MIENQVILDVYTDFEGRVIFTDAEKSAIYMVQNEEITFVSNLIISKNLL